jgi:hypothetical protein
VQAGEQRGELRGEGTQAALHEGGQPSGQQGMPRRDGGAEGVGDGGELG